MRKMNTLNSKCQKVTSEDANSGFVIRNFGSRKIARDLNTGKNLVHQSTSRVKFKENNSKISRNVQFVRNTQPTVKNAHSVVAFTSKLKDVLSEDGGFSDLPHLLSEHVTTDGEQVKLDTPKLCTSLRYANKLLDEAAAESKIVHSNIHDEISSNSRNKVLRNINIPFDEYIYKDLIDLKVTEDDLFLGQDKRSKRKLTTHSKDREPNLSEFYKPSFNEEFIFKVDKIKIEPERLINYDGFSISDRIQYWERSK